jgi:hypothetical protein
MLSEREINEGLAKAEKATEGPWKIWNGPEYVGGGADLCIGAGDKWLSNMDHRNCQNRLHHLGCHDDGCKLEGDADVCSFTSEISEEQSANAALIAAARTLLPAALTDLLALRAKLKALAEEWEANAADFENSKNDQWKNRLSRARLAKNVAARIRKLLGECQ